MNTQDSIVNVGRNFPLGPSYSEPQPISSLATVPFGTRYAVPAVVPPLPQAGTRPTVSTNVPTSPDGQGRAPTDDVISEGID